MLNKFNSPSSTPSEAKLEYLDSDFRILRAGTFVRCAVTGDAIALDELKYWSVDLQEAYASPDAVLKKHAKPRS